MLPFGEPPFGLTWTTRRGRRGLTLSGSSGTTKTVSPSTSIPEASLLDSCASSAHHGGGSGGGDGGGDGGDGGDGGGDGGGGEGGGDGGEIGGSMELQTEKKLSSGLHTL